MSASTETNKYNTNQHNQRNMEIVQGKTIIKDEPIKDLDNKNTEKIKDQDSLQDKNKDPKTSKDSDKNDPTQKKTESKGLLSKIGHVFSNVYEKTKEIILPDLGHSEDESSKNKKEQINQDRDKEQINKVLDTDNIKQQNPQNQDPNLNKNQIKQDLDKGKLPKEDEKIIEKQKQPKLEKHDNEISELTHGLDKQHLKEKSQNIPEYRSESRDIDKENISMNVISGANIPQPDMTGSTKYYVQTLSGHDSSAFDETKRTLPTPNMN